MKQKVIFRYKLLVILLCLSVAFLPNAALAQKTALSGKITDKTTGEVLIGASIYAPDLKSAAVAGWDGTYKLENLPKGKITFKINFLGYKTLIETIDLSVTLVHDFALEPSHIDINTVVVTGMASSGESSKAPVPIVSIDRKEMNQNLNTNIIDALAKLPGVNAVTTGPNVSKPFIRGLGSNRVLTLFDGVRQEGQQWGDEHGIEVDENAVERIEVIKGPASLSYGSDALAGVVNLLPQTPVPDGILKGSLMTNYQSNNGLLSNSLALAGNTKGFVWGGRYTHKDAKNYTNKNDGRVYGTGFQENDVNGYVGLNKHWGYSHLNFSLYDALQQIPDGSRDSASRRFTKQITEADTFRPIVTDQELNSYAIPVIHQHVQHYRVYSSSNILFGKSNLELTMGYQQSVRREYSHPQAATIAGLYLFLQSSTYTAKYHLPEWRGYATLIGLNGMLQQHENKGTEFIIPDYKLIDFGPFALIQKTFKKLNVSAGARLDRRSFNNTAMYTRKNAITGYEEQAAANDTNNANRRFYSYSHTFSGASGSLGATYNFSDNFFIKANIARGFRAPNIAEISANGVHPGTNIYQIGNLNFLPEFALQEDLGLFFSTEHISGSLELFNNDIQNYIYNQKVLNKKGLDSVIVAGNQTFRFQSGQAQLYGGEFSLDLHPHPLDWLHFKNSFSLLYGQNKGVKGAGVSDSARYLPFIPPFHTNTELRADFAKKGKYFSAIYFKVGVQYYAPQNRAYLAYHTETTTPGYVLFDAGLGADINSKSGRLLCSFHLLGNNLMDAAYQSHLSRLKYFESYPGNTSGKSGIYNMGRNFGLKLVIPIEMRRKGNSQEPKQ